MKNTIKKNNNLLDEMQEQKLLKIESRGFAIAFWGSFAAYMIQMLLNRPFEQYVGEMILFFVLCIYSLVFSIRNNIWDRKLKPDGKTNLIISIVAAIIASCILTLRVYLNYPDKIVGVIASGVIFFVMIFACCIITLTVMSAAYKKKVKMDEAKMDADEGDNE